MKANNKLKKKKKKSQYDQKQINKNNKTKSTQKSSKQANKIPPKYLCVSFGSLGIVLSWRMVAIPRDILLVK